MPRLFWFMFFAFQMLYCFYDKIFTMTNTEYKTQQSQTLLSCSPAAAYSGLLLLQTNMTLIKKG